MLEVEHDGGQTLVKINSSSLSLLQTCPRKSFYTLKQGWKSRSGSPPLIFGSAVHKALEIFYSHPKIEREMPVDFDKHAQLMVQGHLPPESHFLYDAISAFITAAEPLRMLGDRDKRSLVSGVWMLTHYFKTYLHDVYVIYRDDSGPFVERMSEATLFEDGKIRIVIHGTIDLVLKNEATGELLPADHKSTSMMGNEFLNRCKPNHQYTGYLFLANRALGMNCENFLINGVEVKAKPVTARGGPPTFVRQITRRTEEDFKEFSDVVRWNVRSYLSWDAQNIWPLGDVNSCSMYGGCQFLDVCSAPNELRQNILQSKFSRPEAT